MASQVRKMKASETLIAWNSINYLAVGEKDAPAGSLAVGPLLCEGDGDWTAPYTCTAGAAYVGRRKLFGLPQQMQVMLDWYMLVYTNGLDPYFVHRAFLLIDEYQTIIKKNGLGPARDEPGHDPNVSYGRAFSQQPPNILIRRWGRATHFWPESCNTPIMKPNGEKSEQIRTSL
jgi:hypothetical protein